MDVAKIAKDITKIAEGIAQDFALLGKSAVNVEDMDTVAFYLNKEMSFLSFFSKFFVAF